MEAEIVALATSGATTLVGLMATELWTQARGRFAALFGRARAEAMAEELEVVREEVLSGGDSEAAASEWASRLRRALAADPQAAAALRALLDEFAPGEAGGPATVQNTVNARTFHGTVIQTGRIGDMRINPGS
ncbi:hypothetical protein [Kitasatospora atroaurantiaca]|uniref:Uncharacterized protein n=1 Tax=Kitasatospora atroaurantiaca TaxID=285545 RepID=A0A561EZ38_9ACTN|nr:hypothetical protein [Kitasatospora atroaurantiaca]TWE20879.1 hypothetical protein FB465_6038 [Kitasatospora atroaurantiaca]